MAAKKQKYMKQTLCKVTRNENEYGFLCLDEDDAVLGKEIELFVGYVYIKVIPIKVCETRIPILDYSN